jgi:hypothetical protein
MICNSSASWALSAVVCAAFGLSVCAMAQAVAVKREEPKFYHYFDAKTVHDYKGYTVGASPESGEIELVLCGGTGEKRKFNVSQLKPDDGPCKGPWPGTWGYAYIIHGDVLGVGNEMVTLDIKTDSGAQASTLPKQLFRDGGAKLAPGDTVVFVANEDLWSKSQTDVSAAFNNWQMAIKSKEKEGTPLAVQTGVPLAVEFRALDWRACVGCRG